MADRGDDVSASWVRLQLSVSAGSEWPHNALRHHWLMPISCHLRDCKALLVTSMTHVIGAITSVPTFTFTCTDSPLTIPYRSGLRLASNLYPSVIVLLFYSSL